MAKPPCQSPAFCETASVVPPGPQVGLRALTAGQVATIAALAIDPADAALLRAMGLRPGARLRVCRFGEPCVVEVLGGEACGCTCATRVGLAKRLAERLMVVI